MNSKHDPATAHKRPSLWQALLLHTVLPTLLFTLSALLLVWGEGLVGLLNLISPTLKELSIDVISVVVWLSGTWWLSRAFDVLLWEGIFTRRLEMQPPQLLKVMLRGLLFLLGLMGVLSGVFALPLTGLWATSGAVGLVIGLALQRIITDAFSGLAMNLDHAVSIGEWVQINQRGMPTYIGRVEEITWRTTRVVTKDNTTLILPNSLLSQMSFMNLSRPAPQSRFKLTLLLPHRVPTERAMRALEVALHSTEGLMSDPLPKVRVKGVTPRGVTYELRYWHDPRSLSPSKARSRIMSASLKALKHAGISAVVPLFIDDELDHSALPADWEGNPAAALAATGLFNDLPAESQAHIAAQLVSHRLSPGQEVVREGAEGTSMFMIAEGAVAVSVQQGESALRVATLTSGDFFGELCLLTGEPRSATVRALTSGLCFELHREAVAEVLAARPELAQTLSEALERRLSSTSERRDEHERSLSASERQEEVLLSRLKRLFRLTL